MTIPAAAIDRLSPQPRSAYIHVPFCRHRCGYCNFTLIAGRDDLIGAYLEALAKELAWLERPREVDTLFLGGGTPTHLSPHELESLLDLVLRWFPLATNAEFSVEANPADITSERAAVLASFGVTRVSLGCQSFDGAKLRTLERDHDAAQIKYAVETCQKFAQSVSLDLIFGVPGESLEVWKNDLAQGLALAPQHLSTYGLTIEKGTPFFMRSERGELIKAGEDLEATMYEVAIDTLAANGLEHYEVSNFARPKFACRHNQTYWRHQPFFAAGPGAASFLGGTRSVNHRSTTTYLNRIAAGESPIAESETLSAEDSARERLVFGLRELAGVHLGEFYAATGFRVEVLGGRALEEFLAIGMLEIIAERLRLTRRGLLISDALWPELLGS